jgi:SagB-type dehydrogenase family enzyme
VEDLAPGNYRYDPAAHALVLVTAGDLRAVLVEQAIGQAWITAAPAIFVISGSTASMARMGERATPFMWVEAGLAAQGFFLEATALGLGSTYVGGFDPPAAKTALGLPAAQEVLAILPVGRRP